ncbi:MAG: DUF6714 family protein [Dolichospermum sp.]
MNHLSIKIENLKEKIESAFSKVPLPHDEYLLSPACQDESDIEDFKGKNWKRWQDIPEQVIDCNYSSLPFLSPSALCFFLPAYLMYGLNHMNSSVLEFTIYKLIAPNNSKDKELSELFISWTTQLTFDQKIAVTLFLTYIKENFEYLSNDANEALESYWNNSKIINY